MGNYKSLIFRKAALVLSFIQTHAAVLFIVVFASMTGYLVMRSGELVNIEPTEKQVFDKKAEIKSVSVDEKSLEILNELKARNIDLDSLFVERENPFEN